MVFPNGNWNKIQFALSSWLHLVSFLFKFNAKICFCKATPILRALQLRTYKSPRPFWLHAFWWYNLSILEEKQCWILWCVFLYLARLIWEDRNTNIILRRQWADDENQFSLYIFLEGKWQKIFHNILIWCKKIKILFYYFFFSSVFILSRTDCDKKFPTRLRVLSKIVYRFWLQ